jgi:hypothetical protein
MDGYHVRFMKRLAKDTNDTPISVGDETLPGVLKSGSSVVDPMVWLFARGRRIWILRSQLKDT